MANIKIKLIIYVVITLLLLSNCTDNCEKQNNNNLNTKNNNEISNNLNNKNNATNNKNNDFSFNIEKPSLPKLKSWVCPEGWEKIYHDKIKDENNNLFYWCEPPLIPKLETSNYITSSSYMMMNKQLKFAILN